MKVLIYHIVIPINLFLFQKLIEKDYQQKEILSKQTQSIIASEYQPCEKLLNNLRTNDDSNAWELIKGIDKNYQKLIKMSCQRQKNCQTQVIQTPLENISQKE
ncbi:unnamed protein product [Paramecium pentaurelia]|uniref:Uncharacterized protein n=1 Tax=Paramecium pentaurelia TaxID=43138 RepID=A0A8S1XB91_9CILI|nr:unnamed protein product [Paramecium pentaurelia]